MLTMSSFGNAVSNRSGALESEGTLEQWLRYWLNCIDDLDGCRGADGSQDAETVLWRLVAVPSWVDPMEMWEPSGPRVRWVPGFGEDDPGNTEFSSLEVTGFGAAHIVRASGKDRWAQVQEQGARVLDQVRSHSSEPMEYDGAQFVPAFHPGGPRLFGGFSFRPSDPPSGAPGISGNDGLGWREFGEATFFLPEITITRDRNTGVSVAAIALTCGKVDEEERLARVKGWFERIAEIGRPSCRPARDQGAMEQEGENRADDRMEYRVEAGFGAGEPLAQNEDVAYAERVGMAVQAIHSGAFKKVVVARSSRLSIGSASEADLLFQMEKMNPQATKFAFGFDESLFFGATPEALVSIVGRTVRTEALAGTRPSSARSTSQTRVLREAVGSTLESSLKDTEEHGFVVEDVLNRLQPLCSVLGASSCGEREAGPVVHLNTKILGRLRLPHHIVEVAERLHPTPAVGGVPREAALSWLDENEQLVRGWYSSPVGWFDRLGGGEFKVALRSALLLPLPDAPSVASERTERTERACEIGPQQRETLLFAGAGVVGASQPTLELAETELKLQALKPALNHARENAFAKQGR